jgi:hypothetical protein
MTTNWTLSQWKNLDDTILGQDNKTRQWQQIWGVTTNWPMKTNLLNENIGNIKQGT